MQVNISGNLVCPLGYPGEQATIYVVPGDNYTQLSSTICTDSSTKVDVGTVTIVSSEYVSMSFSWPNQASQLGNWSACARLTASPGTILPVQGNNLFNVVPAPTPTATPPPTPAPPALPTPTPLATATPTPQPTPTETPSGAVIQQPGTSSGKPLPWGLVLGGFGAVAGAGALSLGGTLFMRRRKIKL
jgi:hypothetical protein